MSEEPTNIVQFPSVTKCPDCNGSGLVIGFSGRVQSQHKCPRCNGQGTYRIGTPRVEIPKKK